MPPTDVADIVIIGGGIIGCAIALDLAGRKKFETIFLLEKRAYLGDGTSTRNSYVIHAGIYYPQGSLKARFCVEGNRQTYSFCRQYGISHRKTGKLIVATSPEEVSMLERLYTQGQANGAQGLCILDKRDMKKVEPNAGGCAALYAPETGVFDTAQWFRTVEAMLYSAGVVVLKKTPVIRLSPHNQYIEVETASRGAVPAAIVVNAAGLYADEIANTLGNDFSIYPCRGDYFVVEGRSAAKIQMAVYPVPEAAGLGIHVTKLWDGTVLLGPDARYVASKEDYRDLPIFTSDGDLDLACPYVEGFYQAAARIFPGLSKSDMRPGYCGIRPKLTGLGETAQKDFHIAPDQSYPQVIHLVGIDSPGLTCALPIARYVGSLIEGSHSLW